MKLSSTILELGCKKSVRVRYVIVMIVLGFTECRGVHLLAIGVMSTTLLPVMADVVLGATETFGVAGTT